MAVVQIPNLPPAISLNGNEPLEIVQAGQSKRCSVQNIANLGVKNIPSQVLDTIADLRALIVQSSTPVFVQGYSNIGDGGGGYYYGVTGYPAGTYVDNGGTIIVDGDGSSAWIYNENQTISIKTFGAVGDGVTDDTAAFTNAWNAATASANPDLYIPKGEYNLNSTTTTFEVVDNMTVRGDGLENTKIIWSNDLTGPFALIGRLQASSQIGNVEITGFSIYGTHGDNGNYTQVSKYPLLVSNVQNLRISRVLVSNSRVMGIVTRGCNDVDVDQCVVMYCARDGINTGDCNYVRVCDCHVSFCDDDGIACAVFATQISDRGVVISNNIVRFSSGIKVLGARSAVISDNLVEFCSGQGIHIRTQAAVGSIVEGINANQGVTIVGNTIKNILNRTYLDGLNTNNPAAYIDISGESAQAGSLNAIPGENDTFSGTVIDPYPYFPNCNNWDGTPNYFATTPISGGYAIVVSGNVISCDIEPTANVSDYGFGVFYFRSGPYDGPVSALAISNPGIRILKGIIKNTVISNNAIFGVSAAINFGTNTKLNAVVSGNTIYNCVQGFQISGANTFTSNVKLTNNIFDLDPLFKSTNRGPNGTYLANGNPTAIFVQGASGIDATLNTFKNVCRVSDSAFDFGQNKVRYYGNVIECNPSAIGFSTSNQGVGNLPADGTRFDYKIVDSDPASATYGDTINICNLDDTGMPTSGTYVIGHFTRNLNPSISGGKVLTGWLRLTTGSSHVVDVDWAPTYSSIT